MYSLFIVAIASFALAFALTPLCRNLAIRWGAVDRPDQVRKLHARPVPRIGGIPIVVAYLGSFAILLLCSLRAGNMVRSHLDLVWRVFPGAALIFFIGLLDDLAGLRPWQKLIGQTVAGVWAFHAGLQITGVAGHALGYWWSLPLTLAWFVGCTNAFNLIDGVDGLAAGVGFCATLTMLAAGLLQGNMALALAVAPLAGSLLGFLRYNFNPASIFLGDSGSLLIGFLLGCCGVIWSQKSATLVGMTAPLMALAIPILDVALSIARRFLRGKPIFGADRGHIHHMLLKRGLTPRRVVLILYGVCGLFAGLSLLQSVFHQHYAGVILILFCAVALIMVQKLGYVEFRMARRILLGGAFQRVLNGQLALRKFEESVSAADSVEACWRAVCEACRDFGFSGVEMHAAGEMYAVQMGNDGSGDCWSVRIPLSDYEWVNLTREGHSVVLPMVVAPFVDAVRDLLRKRLWELASDVTRKPSQVEVGTAVRVMRAGAGSD